jgi:hypothetical protein
VVAAALLAVFGLTRSRAHEEHGALPRTRESTTPSFPAAPASAPSEAIAAPSVQPVLPRPSNTVAASAAVQTAASSSPLRTAPASAARLRLTSDPQASVTVSGGRTLETRHTPVPALSVPAGTYSIVFRSPTFGEPVATQIELLPGESHSVHADFRAAVPTVVVR